MSIRFVQTSDNKYVQYFLTKDEWSIDKNDWEKINLEEEVTHIEDTLYKEHYELSTAGGYMYSAVGSPLTLVNQPNMHCILIDVSEGQIYHVKGYGGSAFRGWAKLDSNGLVTSVCSTTGSNFDEDVTIETGVVKIAVNSFDTNSSSIYRNTDVIKDINDNIDDIQGDITNIQGDITNIKSELTEPNVNIPIDTGYPYQNSGVGQPLTPVPTATHYHSVSIETIDGEKYRVQVYGGDSFRAWATVGSDGLVKRLCSQISTTIDETVTIQSGETGLVINCAVTFVEDSSVTKIGGSAIPSIDKRLDDLEESVETNTTDIAALKNKLVFKKTSSTAFEVDIPSYTGVVLTHQFRVLEYSRTYNDISMLSGKVWSPGSIIDGNTGILSGNLNFIYALAAPSGSAFENEAFHVGPGHGCEIMEWFKLFVDGHEIDFSNITENIQCDSFRFVQKSYCYAVDSSHSETNDSNNYLKLDGEGNKILTATHYIDALFEKDNKITWRNRLIIHRDNLKFAQCHAAMMQGLPPYFDNIMAFDKQLSHNIYEWDGTNLNISIPTGETGVILNAVTLQCDEAMSWGNKYNVSQRMFQDDGERSNKSFCYFLAYTRNGIKTYFMPVVCGLVQGQEVETFNSGDVISVTIVRKIDVKQ